MTGNLPFPDTPQLDAVRTRIRYLHLTLSDNEIIALMKSFSLKGVNKGTEFIEPNECWMVCDFIVSECLGLNRSLDLRLFDKSLNAYLQWRECQSRCEWKDLVSALIKERPIRLGDVKSVEHRSQQKQHELQLAQELSEINDPKKRLALWVTKTGKSQATMYRRLKQLKDE